jgi:hypothetical protein
MHNTREPAPVSPTQAAGQRGCQVASWVGPEWFLSCPCPYQLRTPLLALHDLCYTGKDTNSVPRVGPAPLERSGAMWPRLTTLGPPVRRSGRRALAGLAAPEDYHADHIGVIRGPPGVVLSMSLNF